MTLRSALLSSIHQYLQRPNHSPVLSVFVLPNGDPRVVLPKGETVCFKLVPGTLPNLYLPSSSREILFLWNAIEETDTHAMALWKGINS